MEAAGDRTPKRRSKTKNLGLGSPEAKPLTYPDREKGTRTTSSPNTEAFHVDEGYVDPPRTRSSIVRMGPSPTSSMPQVTPTPSTTAIPKRRQATTHPHPPRPTRKIAQPLEIAPTQSTKQSLLDRLRRMHWLALIGLGMMSALVLWLLGSSALAWGTQRYYDIRYGNPRTFQTDAVVSHGGDSPAHPSHFIAMNLNNQAIVIELKAGDPKKAKIYPVALIDGGQSPVTVSFKDINGDHKPDMVVDIHLPAQDQHAFFINDGDDFRPATSNDVIQTP